MVTAATQLRSKVDYLNLIPVVGETRRVEWQAAHRATGLYLVRLSTDAGVHQMKLMKQ